MCDPNLVTTYNFQGQEFLFKMNIFNNNLEILVTDKSSGEEWQCSYDAAYIENLTQKTGNFKQFDIFVAMIKSGLLKTSESVTLDLLTFDDLELLRSRKITKSVGPASNNRRYLIVTYVVEFDKIRYPLPLEYCGPPDPVILQSTIRRLELELVRTKEELASKNNNNNDSRKLYFLQKRVEELTEENGQLQEEIVELRYYLDQQSKPKVVQLQKVVSNLEKSVATERNSHHELVQKLRKENSLLARELEKIRRSERSLKSRLNNALGLGDYCHTVPTPKPSNHSVKTMFKHTPSPSEESKWGIPKEDGPRPRPRSRFWSRVKSPRLIMPSRSSSSSSANKYLEHDTGFASNSRPESPTLTPKISRARPRTKGPRSRGSSGNSSRGSSRSKPPNKKELDYRILEEKIKGLEKLLKSNLTRSC